MGNTSVLLAALKSLWTVGISTRTAFVLIVATQLTLLGQYKWNEDFLTRPYPLYRPYPDESFLSFNYYVVAADNACMRHKYDKRLEYDYIVVGSGPGGSVVANRLSENSDVKVLLIEAGQDPPVESIVPLLASFNLKSENSWNYESTVVKESSNAYRSGTDLSAGKMLGGSSSLNGMVFLCGTDRDYDTWRAQDNPGWDYNSLLPYFKKFESNKKSGIDKNYHGTEGPLGVGDFKSKDPFIETFRDGYSQLGYNANSDFNAREYNGYVKVQGTIDGGERFSAARAFLLPVKNRPNLTIMKGSIVEKVLFNGTTAIGVKVVTKISECSEIKIYARKEIILSAGAIGTPKILLKSGIGRSADLDPFEIEQVKDLAVGQNYNDHPKSVHFVKVNPDAKAIPLWDQVVDASNYILSRTGTFSYVSSIDFNLIINTTDPKATYPDIFLLGLRTGKAMDLLSDVLYQQGFKQKYIDAVIEANKESEILLVYVHLAKPVARGTVKLRSKSVWEDPIIVTDWYTHSTDINTSVRGIKKLEELIETDAFKKVSAKMIKFDIPECNPLPYPSDDYRKCYLRYFTASAWHQSGTAKMGPITDPNAVVDSRLRVHGIKNLRVVDASIMPDVITTNTQCPTYMIGEKGADMIKQEYQ